LSYKSVRLNKHWKGDKYIQVTWSHIHIASKKIREMSQTNMQTVNQKEIRTIPYL